MTPPKKANKKTILVVLGRGGHTAQMLRLVDLLGDQYEYEYIIARDDPLSEKKITRKGRVWRVTSPRSHDTPLPLAVLRTTRCLIETMILMTKTRAKAIISAGPGLGAIASITAKLLGKKVVFIESWSRVWTPSRSGKLVYPIADLFLVQWPELKNKYPRAIYAGRLA